MRTLTDYQKQFLLDNFFKNEKYAGWRNIATELLESGQCVVAGNEKIWVGGIGNFISIEPAKGAVGCSLYTFDLEYFFTSKWYQDIRNEFLLILSDDKKEIYRKHEEISNI